MLEGYRRIPRSQALGEQCEKKGRRFTKAGKQRGEREIKNWHEQVWKWGNHVKETSGRVVIDFLFKRVSLVHNCRKCRSPNCKSAFGVFCFAL